MLDPRELSGRTITPSFLVSVLLNCCFTVVVSRSLVEADPMGASRLAN